MGSWRRGLEDVRDVLHVTGVNSRTLSRATAAVACVLISWMSASSAYAQSIDELRLEQTTLVAAGGPYIQPNQQQNTSARTVKKPRPAQLSVYLRVPFALGDALPDARQFGGGFGIAARFGWDLGIVVPEFHLGGSLHFVSLDNTATTEEANLFTNLWVAGGARLQLLNRSRFVPFVSAGVRVNFWNVAGTATEISPSLGLIGKVGLMIELSMRIALEVMADFHVSFSSYFDGPASFIAPMAGLTFFF